MHDDAVRLAGDEAGERRVDRARGRRRVRAREVPSADRRRDVDAVSDLRARRDVVRCGIPSRDERARARRRERLDPGEGRRVADRGDVAAGTGVVARRGSLVAAAATGAHERQEQERAGERQDRRPDSRTDHADTPPVDAAQSTRS